MKELMGQAEALAPSGFISIEDDSCVTPRAVAGRRFPVTEIFAEAPDSKSFLQCLGHRQGRPATEIQIPSSSGGHALDMPERRVPLKSILGQ